MSHSLDFPCSSRHRTRRHQSKSDIHMDQLSTMKSITSIVAVAASPARAFEELRQLCNPLQGRLHALGNEVSEFKLILHQITLVVEQNTDASTHESQEAHIHDLLDQAGLKLGELKMIIDSLIGLSRIKRHPYFSRIRGRRISQKYRHCRETSRPSNVASKSCWNLLIPEI